MHRIPDNIGGVAMEFADDVDREISEELFEAMQAAISTKAVADRDISTLWVSSARDRHSCPSRHTTGNGVDISRINGKRIGGHYQTDDEVRAIVDSLQTAFESAPHRRENFGPTIQLKLGEPKPISGHDDHFHWSVDGDHSECSTMFNRMIDFLGLRRFLGTDDQSEICNK